MAVNFMANRDWFLRAAMLLYGVLNAILYASLLPLWEGFDKIDASLRLAPGSASVKRNLPFITTYGQFQQLSAREQRRLRTSLNELHSDSKASHLLNYEAQQPPLAYALLAPADAALGGHPLLTRILFLRLSCAIGAAVMTGLLVFRLGHQLGLASHLQVGVAFVVFSSQMFYAATAHITNDWLAIPLSTLVITSAIDLYRSRSVRAAAGLAIALGAGLLAKSYLIALVPFAAGVVLWLAITRKLAWRAVGLFTAALLIVAGPWYARNLFLYGNLSGMQETTGGIPEIRLLSAAEALPWLRMAVQAARAALWTGNNSFISFDSTTITLQLAAIAIAVALYIKARRTGRRRLSVWCWPRARVICRR
jgi:hypothetical protein